ncbi:uncharacterized protein K02A2.6-like [Corticium candelabrum]|uniref:uncharacterized protein K02A2.6-like n=1 Tax=Corticium candelabrum TaxID=121492 RepID=UPI002E26F415|nr:uncharacterized protein K02A2.6-like [Corticium candelabrum]
MKQLRTVIEQGWPQTKQELHPLVVPYFQIRDELLVQNDVIFKGERIVIPSELRHMMLEKIHYAHLGINGCIRRAKECLFWPGMTAAIRDYVERCETCRLFDHKQHKETLMSHEIPSRPCSKVGSDLFEVKDHHYLVLVDYYSSFTEVERLTTTNTTAVIRAMKKQFARYGVPDTLITDRGPQYTSNEFQDFAKAWEFQHNMSSPGHHQSNGKAEMLLK